MTPPKTDEAVVQSPEHDATMQQGSTADIAAVQRTCHQQPCTLKGHEFVCRDESRWKVGERLSARKLQQEYSPCEARQVFTATCVDDPEEKHPSSREAIVKIGYQVRGTAWTAGRYTQDIEIQQLYLNAHLERADELRDEIKRKKVHLALCETPTNHPSPDTINEMYALRQLRELECAYAPALLTFAGTVACDGVYEDALVGGYSFFILMTKLPGQVLVLGQYCKLSPAERDEIRTAFREALTDVWDCGIVPQDTAARNIMWDAAEKKCYIIDFEDCTLLDPNTETPPDFQEGVYDDWELSEEVVSLYRRCSGWDKAVQQT